MPRPDGGFRLTSVSTNARADEAERGDSRERPVSRELEISVDHGRPVMRVIIKRSS